MEKDALASLQEAYADHNAKEPNPSRWEEPVFTLNNDSFIGKNNTRVFKPLFEIDHWELLPPWLRLPKLPPDTIVKKEEPSSRGNELNDEISF
jgi:hypothetical protein